ncbi:MAG TPA: PA2778 family cysteine peptidase [Noviherbaspirillum sp.]
MQWCVAWWRVVALLVALLLAGCATQTRSLLQGNAVGLPVHAELTATPFHPQERFQCGPAALATVLNVSGVPIVPDALVSQVYVPAREGSLQPEMLAAARRNGTVSMTIPPTLNALLTEVAAGHPVVVLQNLSLSWAPLWHYAVVIGYDLPRGDIILRSGTTERLVMPLSTFEHTWSRGNYWGMVALSPGRLAATVEEEQAVTALVAFERNATAVQARVAYTGALERWPRNVTLRLGLGNALYKAGDKRAAAAVLREATALFPEHPAAFNNLATVLAELGDLPQARAAAEKAVALGGPWRSAARETLATILAAQNRKP